MSVLVWNYHDDDLPAPAADVSLQIRGLPAGRPTLTEYRVDTDHSNAYTAWKRMGAPQSPTPAQYAELERAGRLQTMGARAARVPSRTDSGRDAEPAAARRVARAAEPR